MAPAGTKKTPLKRLFDALGQTSWDPKQRLNVDDLSVAELDDALVAFLGEAFLLRGDSLAFPRIDATIKQLRWQPPTALDGGRLTLKLRWSATAPWNLGSGVTLALTALDLDHRDGISEVTVAASATYKGQRFDAVISLPAATITCRTPAKPNAVPADVLGPLELPKETAASWKLEGFSLDIALRRKHFAINLVVANLFKLAKFQLRETQVAAELQLGAKKSADVAFFADFRVGKPAARQGFDLLVAGRLHATGASRTWSLSAAAANPKGLSVAQIARMLCADTDSQLARLNLPDVIAELVVEKIGFAMQRGAANTNTYRFVLDLALEGAWLSLSLTLGDETKAEATLKVDTLELHAVFDSVRSSSGAKRSVFAASLQERKAIHLTRLVAALAGRTADDLPAVDIGIKSFAVGYISSPKSRAPLPARPPAKSARSSSGKADTNPRGRMLAELALEIKAALNLGNVPILGLKPAPAGAVADLQVVVALAALDKDDIAAFKKAIGAGAPAIPLPAPPPNSKGPPGLAKGLAIRGTLNLGTGTLALGAGGTRSPAVTTPDAPAAPAAPALPAPSAGVAGAQSALPPQPPQALPSVQDGANWFDVQKSIGPLTVSRLGVSWHGGKLWVLADAALKIGPIGAALDGFGFGSELKAFKPELTLAGLSLAYASGPIQLGGSFRRLERKDPSDPSGKRIITEFDGLALARTKLLTASAIGAYAELGPPANRATSLFIYATLDYPIGGPPFFFLTGLAGGFGYNRRLTVPKAEDVQRFPLITALSGQAEGGDARQVPAIAGTQSGAQGGADSGLAGLAARLEREISMMASVITPSRGDYFFGLGVRFNSFELLDSTVVLTARFGHDFELDIFGLSTLLVPTPPPGQSASSAPAPVAELQAATKASFVPARGFLGVRSVLTDRSFLLSRRCRIVGGLAFYAWFKDDRVTGGTDGDVVLTIGGYHKDFRVPRAYPVVPRVGLNWKIDDNVSITGSAYFALTPHAVMAGGHFKLLWSKGPLSAWIIAGADLLLAWKPYHYDLQIGVSIGAKLVFWFFGEHHVSVELGGNLHLFGPEFSGRVSIHYYVVSVTVSFGSGRTEAKPIAWEEFRKSFLPSGGLAPRVRPVAGLIGDKERSATRAGKAGHWVLNPKDVRLEVDTALPLTEVVDHADIRPPAPIGIAAMGVKSGNLKSRLTVVVRRHGESNPVNDFRIEVIQRNLPAALWKPATTAGKVDDKPELNGARTVPAITGIRLKPRLQPGDGPSTPLIDSANLRFETDTKDQAGRSLTFGFERGKRGRSATMQGSEASAAAKTATVAARKARAKALAVLMPGQRLDADPLTALRAMPKEVTV